MYPSLEDEFSSGSANIFCVAKLVNVLVFAGHRGLPQPLHSAF